MCNSNISHNILKFLHIQYLQDSYLICTGNENITNRNKCQFLQQNPVKICMCLFVRYLHNYNCYTQIEHWSYVKVSAKEIGLKFDNKIFEEQMTKSVFFIWDIF